MLKTNEFKNKTVATIHGNVKFDKDGIGESNEKAEKFLAKFGEFWVLEEEPKEEPQVEAKEDTPEKEETEVKKTAKKATTRKPRATTKKPVEK